MTTVGLFALSLVLLGASAQDPSLPPGGNTLPSSPTTVSTGDISSSPGGITLPGGTTLAPVPGDLGQCLNEQISFVQCAAQTLSPNSTQLEDLLSTIQKNVSGCFSQSQCQPPKNDSSNGIDQITNLFNNISQPVKQCISNQSIIQSGQELVPCLAQLGFPNINISDLAKIPDLVQNITNSSLIEQQFVGALQTVQALRQCAGDKGNDTNAIQPVEQCLQGTKGLAKQKICQILQPCAGNVSGQCLSLGEQLNSALCKCNLVKQQTIANNLNQLLQSGNQQITLSDLIGTFGTPQQLNQTAGIITQCFGDNNEQIPDSLQSFIGLLQSAGGSNGTGNGTGSGTNGTGSALNDLPVDIPTVTILRDVIQLDANDTSQCEPCSNSSTSSSPGFSTVSASTPSIPTTVSA